MHIGHYISGAIHAGLIGWMLVGDVLSDDSEDLTIMAVSIISPEAFAEVSGEAVPQPVALPAPDPEPQPSVADRAPNLETPPLETESLAPGVPSETPVVRSETPTLDPVQVDPETLPPAPLLPVPTPEVATAAPEAVAPVPETGAGTPEISFDAAPRFAPRIAPEPAPPPPADEAIALLDRAAPSPDAEAPPEPEPEAPSQRQEATSRIVPEVQRNASGAVGASLRPRARAAVRSAPLPQPSATARGQGGSDAEALAAAILDPDPAGDAISDALFEALASNAPDLPVGPPLSASEADALRVAVQACWVVDVGSEAANVTVTVGMSMNDNGTVRPSTLRLLRASSAPRAAVDSAFQAARRAVLRCERGGYQMPAEKYAHWKDIEITFNPAEMRLR